MKKTLSIVLALAMLTFMLAACGQDTPPAQPAAPTQEAAGGTEMPNIPLPPEGDIEAMAVSPEPIEIMFLSYSNNPFWDQINEGLFAATAYLSNFNATVTQVDMGDEADGRTFSDYIETLMLQEPAAIVACPMADGTEVFVDRAVEAGITVVTYLSESNHQTNTRIAFSGSDAIAGGQAAAQAIADFTGGEGTVGIITGHLTMNQHEERRLGMSDRLETLAPGITILEPVEAMDSTSLTYDAAINLITAYPDLRVIYCTAGGPFGAAQAVRDQGKTGEIGVVCFDWVPDNVIYVHGGEIIAAISQDPQAMAFNAIVMAFNNAVTGWVPSSPVVLTSSDILTPENLSQKLPGFTPPN